MDKEAQQLIAVGILIFLILIGIGGCGALIDIEIEFDRIEDPTGNNEKESE